MALCQKNILLIGISIFPMLFLLGCGSKLSQYEAETIIKSWYPHKSDAYSIAFVTGVQSVDGEQVRQFDELKKLGFIDYRSNGVNSKDSTLQDIEIKITETGKPYVESIGSANSKM